jgi:ATP-binding protein involved in chromosome partitioning
MVGGTVKILGMVQNMSIFICPHCNNSTHVFGTEGGVIRECSKHGVDFLGDIPLDATICQDADRGKPTVAARKGSLTDAYLAIAKKVADKIF